METKSRGRHRLGGKHSNPIIVPTDKKPAGKHAAPVIPAPPTRVPTIHKAAVVVAEKTNTGFITVVKHRGKISALAAIATGGLLIVGGGAAPASDDATATSKPADLETHSRAAVVSDLEMELNEPAPITVPIDVLMNQDKVEVKTAPAPKHVAPAAPAPVAVAKPAAPKHVAPKPVVSAPLATAKAVAPAAKPAPAPAVVAPSSGRAAIIASAALGQIGRTQDCTRLVTNALAVAGIKHHGWPISYYAVGVPVSAANAIPGDLVYYVNGGAGLAHIAVYIGNGKAVHGGWNGNQTVVQSVNVGSGPQYIRV